jgi:ABC-type nitrate/sulfonate/bicarbonate transport system substrate-binding protein
MKALTMWGLCALLLAFAAPALPGCTKPPQTGPARLTVLVMPYLGYAPIYVAQEEGCFARQGLEVEFVTVSDTAQSVPLLAQGRMDVFAGFLTPAIINAIARGGGIRFVSDKGHIGGPGERYAGVVVRRELVESGKLNDPSRLRGLTFSCDPMAASRYMLDRTLEQGGLSHDDITHVDIPAALRPEAVARGVIDGFVTSEPWITRTEPQGVVYRAAGDVIPGFQMGLIAYGPRLLGKDRDLGRRFMVAYLEGARKFSEGKTDRNLDILSRRLGLDTDFLLRAAWPVVSTDGRIEPGGILDFERWAVKNGWVDKVVPESEFWDGEFVDYANKALAGQGE